MTQTWKGLFGKQCLRGSRRSWRFLLVFIILVVVIVGLACRRRWQQFSKVSALVHLPCKVTSDFETVDLASAAGSSVRAGSHQSQYRDTFGARGMSSVRYGTRLGDLKNKQSTHTHSNAFFLFFNKN